MLHSIITDAIKPNGDPFIVKMENKDYIYLGILAVLIIGGVTYEAFENETEITCRTNKPYGWNILELYENGIVKAECPYITKESVITYCKGFRSTPSYERYGCQEMDLVEKIIFKETGKGNEYICSPEPNYGCVPK